MNVISWIVNKKKVYIIIFSVLLPVLLCVILAITLPVSNLTVVRSSISGIPSNTQLKDGREYSRNFQQGHKNTVQSPKYPHDSRIWYQFENQYYFINGHGWGDETGLLYKYDSETDTYTSLAHLGIPRATVLYNEYVYFTFGREGWRWTQIFRYHNPPTVKREAFARISLNSLEIEAVTKSDFINIFDAG